MLWAMPIPSVPSRAARGSLEMPRGGVGEALLMRSCPQCANPCDDTHRFCPSCGFPVGKIVPSADDPLIGRTLPGGYLILELVRTGGIVRVYRPAQTNLPPPVPPQPLQPPLARPHNT